MTSSKPSSLAYLIQRIVLEINRTSIGLSVNRILYKVIGYFSAFYLYNTPHVQAIYARGSFATGEIYPGLSDIDIHIITNNLNAPDLMNFLKEINRRFNFLASFLPVFNKFYTYTEAEYKVCQTYLQMYHLEPWTEHKLLFGKELRGAAIQEPALKLLAWTRLFFRRQFKYMSRRFFNLDKLKRKTLYLKPNIRILTYMNLCLSFLDKNSFPSLAGEVNSFNETINPNFQLFLKTYTTLNKNHFRLPDEQSYISNEYANWYFFLDSFISKISEKNISTQVKSSDHLLTKDSIPPENLRKAIQALQPFINKLNQITGDIPLACLLSSVPNKNYDFKLYVVLPDDTANKDLLEIARKTSLALAQQGPLPSAYFHTFSVPILISVNIFRHMNYLYKSNFEPFYFKKHGIELLNRTGLDFKSILETSPSTLFMADLENYFGFIKTNHRKNKRSQNNFSALFIDYVTGTLPSLKLLINKNILTTTPAESHQEHHRHYKDDFAVFLNDFYSAYIKTDKQPNTKELFDIYESNFGLIKNQVDQITENLIKHKC
jgi:hypothetical protein